MAYIANFSSVAIIVSVADLMSASEAVKLNMIRQNMKLGKMKANIDKAFKELKNKYRNKKWCKLLKKEDLKPIYENLTRKYDNQNSFGYDKLVDYLEKFFRKGYEQIVERKFEITREKSFINHLKRKNENTQLSKILKPKDKSKYVAKKFKTKLPHQDSKRTKQHQKLIKQVKPFRNQKTLTSNGNKQHSGLTDNHRTAMIKEMLPSLFKEMGNSTDKERLNAIDYLSNLTDEKLLSSYQKMALLDVETYNFIPKKQKEKRERNKTPSTTDSQRRSNKYKY